MPAGLGIAGLYFDLSCFQVNVAPVEAFGFGRAQPGKRADCDVGDQIGGSDLKEASDLAW